jgi:hypothetical protein
MACPGLSHAREPPARPTTAVVCLFPSGRGHMRIVDRWTSIPGVGQGGSEVPDLLNRKGRSVRVPRGWGSR